MAVYSKAKHPEWQHLTPGRSRSLTDARLQLHHAAQFAACLGISYLPHAADDSHTNMEWIAGALASNPVGPRPFRLGVRPDSLSLVVLAANTELASFDLDGRTIDDGTRWIRARVAELGLDPDRYSLAKHYAIPNHRVARGLPFDASYAESFRELARWFSNAALMLGRFEGSPVRCWPHHFDIATLLGPIGVGMEPGDVYYDEPYWYVNMSPPPAVVPSTELAGGGAWHSHEWIGAVLPGSRLRDDGQEKQTAEFLDSAVNAIR